MAETSTRRLTATLVAVVLTVGAAASTTPSAARTTLRGCPPAGREALTGGELVTPTGARPGATPLLVVVVPGGGGDRADRLGIARAATRRGLAVLYPTGRRTFWQLNHAQGDGDVTRVKALLARTLATGCFDPRRLSITGVSNGAGFATRMACEDVGRYAAAIPVSAGFRALDPCPPAARTSLLVLHGSADSVVPYAGRPPGREGSVPRFAGRWARRLGCATLPRSSRPRPRVTRITWAGCGDGLSVVVVRLSGSTHGWFGAHDPRFPQRNPSGFRATPAVVAAALAARRP